MKEKVLGWIVFLTLIALTWWGSAQPGSARIVGMNGDATLREVAASWVREQKEMLARQPASGRTAMSSGSAGIVVGDEAAENAILEMINEERAKQGLPPLAMDEDLRARARERSRDMLERGYFSHYDPQTGHLLTEYAENLAQRTGIAIEGTMAPSVARNWWNSPGHYANIIDPGSHRAGIGVAWTSARLVVTAQFAP